MNIYDVAKKAGVSIATVSRVLNGSSSVSTKTRERVEKAIEEGEYTPNIFARGLGLNSIKMIGVLCTDVADMYYAKAVSVIERLLRKEEYDVLLYCTGEDYAGKCQSIERLLEKRVDAIITIGSAFCENLTAGDFKKAAASVPIITVNAEIALDNIYSVRCDEESAVYSNVNLLKSCGREKLLYVYDAETASGRAKLSGYKNAINDLTLKSCATLKVKNNVVECAEVLKAYLKQHTEIDGIITSEDLLAVGVLQATDYLNKSIPVIGFNNSILAECTLPRLTSVDNMVESLCTTAITLLSDIFKDKPVSQRVVLSPRLVERESFKAEKK